MPALVPALSSAARETPAGAKGIPMWEMFQLGGFVMFPVAIFGVLTVLLSAKYGALPSVLEQSRLRTASLLTLICGTLGTVVGLMVSMHYAAGKPEQGTFIALGSYESLHNLALALTLLAVSGIVRLGRSFFPGGRNRAECAHDVSPTAPPRAPGPLDAQRVLGM